ncbi:phage major capsid protein [uncultured Winogradskyella sp.]|uniref:phage major capsid protein n=1 Tax=uncultured Winogradskyella sp. TaxID=395353 RepID=UPI0030EF0E57|tara:strand:+ start:458 stop:1717 length:1260 start_codon:yes stop_codon:yes gene_type:complete
MDPKEFDALMLKIESAIGTSMDTKLKDAFKAVDPLVLKAISAESEGLKKTILDLEVSNGKLDLAQKTQSDLIEGLTKKLKKGNLEGLSFTDQVGTLLTANKDRLTAMKNGDSKTNIRMSMKAVGNMTIGSNVTGQIPQAERENGITRVVRRDPFMVELVNVGSITSNLLEWVQQATPEGDAEMTAEGALKAKIDFDLVLASAPVRKVTAFIKVSKEMLDDVPLIQAEINQELTEVINLKIDAQILSGDGTGQNIIGIQANAVPFIPGSFAMGSTNEVTLANNADVLRVAVNQIAIAEFQANYILMHPTDLAAMDTSKTTEGQYVLPPFSTNANTIVKGIPIIANTGITEGEYLVGDFTKAGVRFREGLVFDIGYENDDFTKNFVTILAEARMVQRVKSNHYPAFVKGNFMMDKMSINKA